MQCACAILSSVACPAVQYFSTFFPKRHNFRKKKTLFDTKYVFWFPLQILSQAFLILRRNERDEKKWIWVFMWSARYSCQSLMKLEFSRHIFEKILKYQISWKSVQWEPSFSVRTDGPTDMTKLIVALHDFAKAPKNVLKRISISFPFVIMHRNSAAFLSVVAGTQKCSAIMNHKLKTGHHHHCW